MNSRKRLYLACLTSALLSACSSPPELAFPGSTEWDRNTVLAEVSERVLEWRVAEGDIVAAGEVLLTLDTERLDARVDQAAARLAEARALKAELDHGPRAETIRRARAELESATAAVVEAGLEFERVDELLRRALTSEASVDQARAARDQRQAEADARRAALDELLAGTRPEQIEQAASRVAALEAELGELNATRARLTVRAPREGRVDALPFKPGDQPRAGDALASLLVGDGPIARIFVPAAVRAGFAIGDRFEIRVEGLPTPFRARLRSIRSEASFTPYYALTGNDASRLVYRAELRFEGPDAGELPAGLPLIATPLGGGSGDD